MTVNDWISVALFGVIFGSAGQMIRVALGLRKLNQSQIAIAETHFSGNRLVLSLVYGALAGVTALVGLASGFGSDEAKVLSSSTIVDPSQTLTIMAAGYAGADAIEGFVKNYLPSSAFDQSKPSDPEGAVPDPDGGAEASKNKT